MDPSLQGLLLRIDSLPEELRDVREGVRKAVLLADLNPELALARSRKVLEFVVRDVYERRYRELAGTRPLENLLQRLVRDGYLPTRLDAHANAVRLLGSVGTHGFGQAVTAADVQQSLTSLLPILDWYAREERPSPARAEPAEIPQRSPAARPAERAPTDPGLRSLLRRVDRLSEEFRDIREGVRMAALVADLDPEMALVGVRKALTLLVREVYQRRCQEPPGTRPLENLIQRLVKDGHFPGRLEAYANTVRMLGNVGGHSFDEQITGADVQQSLAQLLPILDWYVREERSGPARGEPAEAPPRAPAGRAPTDPGLRSLLRRVDRLPEKFRDIREGVRMAALVADLDPEMALTRVRKVLTLVVHEVYERRCQEPPGTRPLENLIQRLIKDEHLPTRLAAYANTVRLLGNVGTHLFGERITAADVQQSLAQLLPILDWYVGEGRPGPARAEPADGSHQPPAAPSAGGGGRAGLADGEAFGSQTIVVHYPTPVAIAYRRFCQQDQPRERMERLFKAFEAALKYLVLLGASDLLHCLAESGGAGAALPDHPAFHFLRVPTKMTLGRWAEALRETARALAGHRDCFLEPLPEVGRPGGHLDDILGGIIADRNLAEHGEGSLPLTEDQCRQTIRETHPKLLEMLQAVRFVREYPLGFMRLLSADVPGQPGLYSVHACRGAGVLASEPGCAFQSEVRFADQVPFLAAPDGSKLLYLWPLWLQREAEHSQRPTLYGFETILGSRGRFLTRLRSAAIDQVDGWEVCLREQPATSHAWLLERLRNLPACPDVAPQTRLLEYLLPARGDELLGRQLGPYRLQAIAGYGGFAVVYEAVHVDDGRHVAVKVLDLPGDYREMTRFEHEFDRLKRAGAGHRGIIPCHERDRELIDRRLYAWYAMDFATGGDLADCLAQRRAGARGLAPWSRPELRPRLIREYRAALAAVAHLHRLDFVHRDIKPSNLLIMEDGELRLSDFGLVKNLNPSERSLLRTATSRRGPAGTWSYMPPEQQRGEEVGKTADVYALGMVLAELATGACPEPKAPSREQSTLQHHPALRALPARLRQLIQRCTAVEPQRRPADALALQEEFEKAIAGLADGAGS